MSKNRFTSNFNEIVKEFKEDNKSRISPNALRKLGEDLLTGLNLLLGRFNEKVREIENSPEKGEEQDS